MRRLYVLCLGLVVSLSQLASAAGLPPEVVNRYRAAIDATQQAYKKIAIKGTVKVDYGPKKSIEQKFVFRVSGKKRRLDLKTLKQQGMGAKVGRVEMRMATPDGSLATFTNPGSEVFNDATETGYDETSAKIDQGCLVNYVYSLDGQQSVLDLLLGPGVYIQSVKKLTVEGQDALEIIFTDNGHKSWVVLDPAKGWALLQFSWTSGPSHKPTTRQGSLGYSGLKDGVPLVSAIQVETLQGTQLLTRETVSITGIELGDPDPDEFYFTAFGF